MNFSRLPTGQREARLRSVSLCVQANHIPLDVRCGRFFTRVRSPLQRSIKHERYDEYNRNRILWKPRYWGEYYKLCTYENKYISKVFKLVVTLLNVCRFVNRVIGSRTNRNKQNILHHICCGQVHIFKYAYTVYYLKYLNIFYKEKIVVIKSILKDSNFILNVAWCLNLIVSNVYYKLLHMMVLH